VKWASIQSSAQAPAAEPPAVGVVKAERRVVMESSEFAGRIQAAFQYVREKVKEKVFDRKPDDHPAAPV